MARRQPDVLALLRAICLELPETTETPTWGEPHFRVAGKIFAGCGDEQGRAVMGFKLEREHAEARVAGDPRFRRAPYVGHKGWVSMDARGVRDREELRALLLESYRLIAPKRLWARFQAGSAAAAPARPASKRIGTRPRSRSGHNLTARAPRT